VDLSDDESRDVIKFAQKQAAEAADLRLKVVFLERRLRQMERRLDTKNSSWTWRLGRIVLFPVTLARYVRDHIGRGT